MDNTSVINNLDVKGFFARNRFTGAINWVSWIITVSLCIIAAMIFFVFNRAVIVGKENIPEQDKNVLFMSNHISYAFDSFFIGMAAIVPKCLVNYFNPPYHPTAYEHCNKNRLLKFLTAHLRCIPVKRKWKNSFNESEKTEQFDIESFNLVANALREGTVIQFPEGTRSKDGNLLPGRAGAGRLPYETKATVIPVRITGLDKLWPKGAKFLTFGNELKVVYGKPLDLSDLYALPRSKEVSQQISDRVMEAISKL